MARINVLAEMAKGLRANVHAVDNQSPVSRIAVYVRAGSRYEPDHLPGVSHHIRAAAGLTTLDSSIFGITRHMERAGASFKVTSNREYIIYRLDCLRERLDYVLGFVDDTIHKPEYRSWELSDHTQPKLKQELEFHRKNQSAVTNEAMHKAAFRGGLAHSIVTPEHRIAKMKREDLFEYLESNFVLDRMTFTGLGCNPEELRSFVEEKFRLNNAESRAMTGESRYIGGGESRVQAGFPLTQVNYVVQGMPVQDQKGLAALEVISNAIGTQISTPYGMGADKTLSNVLSSCLQGTKASIINLNYRDTGLFGISLLGPNTSAFKDAVKVATKHVKQVLSGINENDLKVAKRVAKVRSLIQSEDQNAVFEAMANRHAGGLAGQGPLELVESLSLKDVQTVAGQLLKSRPTIAVVGNPRFVPYIDELD